jgi:hypothetical protein
MNNAKDSHTMIDANNSGKRIRLSRIVQPHDNRAAVVAFDHGVHLGAIPGTYQPGAMLEIERCHMNMPLGRSNCGRSNSCSRGRKRSLSESTAEVPAEAERAGGPGWEGSA